MWLKNIWKLATQICHRCTLKDQVHLITKTSATKLAHPLVSSNAESEAPADSEGSQADVGLVRTTRVQGLTHFRR